MIRNAEQKSAQLFSSSENVNTEYIDTLYQGAYVLYTEIKNEPSENRTEPFVGEGSVMMITIIFQSGAVPLRASGLRRIIMRRMERKKK